MQYRFCLGRRSSQVTQIEGNSRQLLSWYPYSIDTYQSLKWCSGRSREATGLICFAASSLNTIKGHGGEKNELRQEAVYNFSDTLNLRACKCISVSCWYLIPPESMWDAFSQSCLSRSFPDTSLINFTPVYVESEYRRTRWILDIQHSRAGLLRNTAVRYISPWL